MERTLDTVLRSLGNPSIASGMMSRSPSPTGQATLSHPLLATPSPPDSPVMDNSNAIVHNAQAPNSPKLPSLPDNSLNPLGLLAEASLANRRAQAASRAESRNSNTSDNQPKVGVASDLYFKPGTSPNFTVPGAITHHRAGPMTILPLRRLYIERQIQPEMLSFVSTEEVVALFKIYFDKMAASGALHLESFLADGSYSINVICSTPPSTRRHWCARGRHFC